MQLNTLDIETKKCPGLHQQHQGQEGTSNQTGSGEVIRTSLFEEITCAARDGDHA